MTATAAENSPRHGRPTFTAILASEWTKFAAMRFSRVMVVLALVLAAGSAAVFLLTTTTTQGEPLEAMRPTSVAEVGLLGTDLANLVMIVLAASTVAAEYSSGQIRITLSASPRRGRVLAAKITLLTLAAAAVGVAAALLSHFVTRVVLAARAIPALGLDDPAMLRLLAGAALMVPFYALLSAAFAFVTRNTGGAVAAVLVAMSVSAVVGVLPDAAQRVLLPPLPVSALHNLAGTVSPGALDWLPPAAAALVLVAWAAAAILLARTTFERRDA